MVTRCRWAENASPFEQQYHDEEWGVPVYDDRLLFEFLILEGAQAGLSWSTIFAKRENYRAAFDNFDANLIVKYDDAKIAELLGDAGIVRNKLKVNSVVTNAKAFLTIQVEYGSFADYIWGFVDPEEKKRPIQNAWETAEDVPVSTEISDAMSKSLKKKGFKFVGTTICYAYMQAVGMVNDHTVDCFRYDEVKRLSE